MYVCICIEREGEREREPRVYRHSVPTPNQKTMDTKRVRKAQAPVAEAPAVSAPAVAATVGAEARDNDTKVEETASASKSAMASTEVTKL